MIHRKHIRSILFDIPNPFHRLLLQEAEDTEEKENQEALSRYKMVDARLRRFCERKPTGKLNVPQSIHEQWLQVGKPRDELRQLLEQLEFDKEPT